LLIHRHSLHCVKLAGKGGKKEAKKGRNLGSEISATKIKRM
jgi:hypothetical protein